MFQLLFITLLIFPLVVFGDQIALVRGTGSQSLNLKTDVTL